MKRAIFSTKGSLRIRVNHSLRVKCKFCFDFFVLEDYTNAIYEGKSKYVTNYTIDSKRHNLETKEQYKIAIDPFDDKGIKDSNGEFRFYQ